MNTNNNIKSWFNFIPKKGKGLYLFIIVIIVTFFLGYLLNSGGGPGEESALEHDQHPTQAESEKQTLWTCSMHPQIKLPKPGKCPICLMDLIPLETTGGEEIDFNQIKMTETAKKLANIQTTPVKRDFAEAEIRMVGKVTYDETRLVYITAWVPGRITRLYADYTGVPVNAGEHMAEIYSPELYSAQEELINARQMIDKLKNSKSKNLVATARTTLEAARKKLLLFGISETQVDAIENLGEISEYMTINAPAGGVVVAKNAKEGMYVKTGTRIYTIAELTTVWVMFDAYESDLSWLQYGQKVEFTSPSFPGEKFFGKITFIDPVLNDKTRTVNVRVIVDNKNKRLKPDMFASGIVKSRLDEQGHIIEKSLAGKWIGPMHPEIIKDAPGDCDICGMPLVPAESLGYATTANIEKAPLLIPITAPLITGTRAVVYVQVVGGEETIFEGREVILGPRTGDYYIVKSGLSEGELVVTNGAFKIDSELQIQAKPSMMNPEGGAKAPVHNHGAHTPVTDRKTSEKERGQVDINVQILNAVAPVYNTYFRIQMALASDDLAVTIEGFKDLMEKVKQVDISLFNNKSHEVWMELSKEITEISDKGKLSKDISAAREAFYRLSKSIINLHDAFGHSDNQDYYLTFCPMANNNKGAYWLQTVDTVYNSFYGAMMLRCGEIKKELPSISGEDK